MRYKMEKQRNELIELIEQLMEDRRIVEAGMALINKQIDTHMKRLRQVHAELEQRIH